MPILYSHIFFSLHTLAKYSYLGYNAFQHTQLSITYLSDTTNC